MNTESSVQSQQLPAMMGMNGQAVASLVSGIVSLVFFWGGWLFVATSLFAIATGVRGSRTAKSGRGQLGIATAGMVITGLAEAVPDR